MERAIKRQERLSVQVSEAEAPLAELKVQEANLSAEAQKLVATRGTFSVAISGGSLPKILAAGLTSLGDGAVEWDGLVESSVAEVGAPRATWLFTQLDC